MPTVKTKKQGKIGVNNNSLSEVAKKQTKAFPYLIIFLISCLLYSNTLWNKYAIDDGIVITENIFTQKGFAGLKDIFTHDAFAGTMGVGSSALVAGGRYRPLSIASFAIEQGFWGQVPAASHAINVLLFACCCLLIFYLLNNFFSDNANQNIWHSWPFWATVLFVIHPLHTEVVANIKGRDEILAMLFSIAMLIKTLQYKNTQNFKHLIVAVILFFAALLSKENAITFWAIVPLSYYYLSGANLKQYITTSVALLIPIILFLLMRLSFSISGIDTVTTEVMNDPFVVANGIEKYATIILTWLYYFKLLIAPITLSHDYYFNQIPFVDFSSLTVILSIIIHLVLLFYVAKNLRSKNLISYSILYYFITFSVVSNLFFSVGTLMNERFLFLPSLGFCIAFGYLFTQIIDKHISLRKPAYYLMICIGVFYSFKTFSRNFDWKNNLTLLEKDVQNSPNSAKANSTYGGLLYEETLKTQDTVLQNELLATAYEHLQKSLTIYPNYSDALQLYGNVLFRYKKDYRGAIDAYQKAMEINTLPNAKLLLNLALSQIKIGDALNAKMNLQLSNQLSPNQYGCVYSMGEACELLNQLDSAIFWYQKSNEIQPKDGIGYYKIGAIWGKKRNNMPQAIYWLQKAVDLEPQNLVFLEDLAVAKGISGDAEGAINIATSIIKINPNYTAAYRILYTSYLQIGNKPKADSIMLKTPIAQ